MTLPADHLAVPADRQSLGRLVFVHGFTQTRMSWAATARALNEDGYEAMTVDLPGHGEAGEVIADLITGAGLLAATGQRATYVGYSMGGRLALHLALARPDLVERLVLVSSTAGLRSEEERASRRIEDERRAADIERRGVATFLEAWLKQPLFANLAADAALIAARLDNTAAGLASSLRLAGTGAQRSLWPDLPSLSMPVLLVVGALDPKFAAIAEQMAALISDAVVQFIPDAGHVAHLEQPGEFRAVLRRWLDSSRSPPQR